MAQTYDEEEEYDLSIDKLTPEEITQWIERRSRAYEEGDVGEQELY